MRDRFPILQRCTYLASHSLGAVPSASREALGRYYEEWASLGILAWDGPWWEAVGDFSARLERILGAASGTIVPMLNATQGMAAVASCLDYRERPKMVLSELEFTTSFPFWKAQEGLGAEVVVLDSPDGVSVPVEAYQRVVDERTRLVLSSHAWFRSGALQDVAGLSAVCRAAGAWLLVDGYQSLGSVPLELSLADFVVGGCHKWLCGGPGAGFLYVHPRLVGELEPRLTGWFGLENPFAYEPKGLARRHPGVLRFLNGTPNVPAFYAAREGLKCVEELGVPAIRQRSLELTGQVMAFCRERGVRVRTPQGEGRNGMVCLDLPRETQKRLEEAGVITDWRPDCGLRVSPHFYNDESDLERLFSLI